MTKEKMWKEYLIQQKELNTRKLPQAFYFCDNEKDANECAILVEQGVKKATATLLWWFLTNNEAIPQVGDKYIVTDWIGKPTAIIETTKIEKIPFNKITPEFAETEGEGDKSLTYWKEVHEAYYKREMEAYNECFNENMIIVCEYFKKIFPN